MSVFEYSDKVTAMRPSIIRELLKQMADPRLISFAGGNPAAEAFPAREIREISDELLREDAAGTLQYSVTEGYPPLIEAAKEYLGGRRGAVARGDGVMITSGSQQVMDFMSKLLCNEGDIVAADNPAFLGALNSFRSNGARIAGVDMEGDGPSLASLEAALSAAQKPKFFYTIPNFQNPTGCTATAEKRRAIYGLCREHGVPILEDNPYGELRFSGEDIPPIKSLDTDGIVVYAASMSKIFAPGMRVAFCAAPAEMIAKMTVAKQGNDVHTPLWSQRVIARFFERCDFGAHIARLREVYGEKARRMAELFETRLAGLAECAPTEGGMFLWLTLPRGVDVSVFVRRCLEERLALVPGSAFFADTDAPCQSVRANFSTPTFAQMDEGVEIMRRILLDMQNKARP